MTELEPGWYLDTTGDPIKVWAGGGMTWYADEGDKALPISPSIMRMLALTMSDWELVRQALEAVYWDHRAVISPTAHDRFTADIRERLHAIAGTMYPRPADA